MRPNPCYECEDSFFGITGITQNFLMICVKNVKSE